MAPAPFFGNDSYSTTSSLLVKWVPHTSPLGGGDVVAYELSQRSIYNTHWDVVSSSIGGSNISEVQIVSIRVNPLSPRLSGTFRLGIERYGLLMEDFEKTVITPRISYQATASEMKKALDEITSIKVRDVKRCDEINLPGDPGGFTTNNPHIPVAVPGGLGRPITISGGFDGWASGCPHNSAGEGGYRWLIVFDIPARSYVPKLLVAKNELRENTWTQLDAAALAALPDSARTSFAASQGIGPQIMVTRVTRGMHNPSLCFLNLCTFNVTGLKEGIPYMFRTRVLTQTSGWTEYSKASEMKTTLENRPPSRPRPPTLSTVTGFAANLNVQSPVDSENVRFIECYYRRVDTGEAWQRGPHLDLAQLNVYGDTISRSHILNLKNLKPETYYEARVRTINPYGVSEFSPPSESFITRGDMGLASIPLTPELALNTSSPVTSSSVNLLVKANPSHMLPATATSYKIQYRRGSEGFMPAETDWNTVDENVVFYAHREGVETQRIITRSTERYVQGSKIRTVCSGSFWLRLGVTETDNVPNSVTSPIPFDASSEVMTEAIRSIGVVRAANPRITIHRSSNEYNGFSWVVEMQGMGDVTRLQLYKHTLVATAPGDNQEMERLGDCYSENPEAPVLTDTIKDGTDVYTAMESVVTIGGLLPDQGYLFRTELIDPSRRVYRGPVSNTTSIRTLRTFTPIDPAELLTIGMDGVVQRERLPDQDLRPKRDSGKPIRPPTLVAGKGPTAAKINEEQYMTGAGAGGQSAQQGGHGLCVLTTYNPRKSQPTEIFQFFYTGYVQSHIIRESTPDDGYVSMVTFKCWGGGGGGAKISDLVGIYKSYYLRQLSSGGGGAFAQVTVYTQPGDVLSIFVGGGGEAAAGQRGGKGGYSGGGDGGNALVGGGGGGGGASVVKRGDEVLLVAGGGGGGGSTDYCCATGGAGGDLTGIVGTFPAAGTPWPLTAPGDDRPTPAKRRYEYTSSSCPDGALGSTCISEWDILPGSLPAEHQNLQWGAQGNANYSVWATAGFGGGPMEGGKAGDSGSYTVRTTGDLLTITFAHNVMPVAVYSLGEGLEIRGQDGFYMQGGFGAGGKEGGGGGGGGYWGGGGGGSGIDGAGGGGGSSYYNKEASSEISAHVLGAQTPIPDLLFINESAVTILWTLRWDQTVWGSASSFAIEYSAGTDSQEFNLAGTVKIAAPSSDNMLNEAATFTKGGLPPNSPFAFRVIPIFPKGRGPPSQPLVIRTLNLAVNYWEPLLPRRQARVSIARGISNPVTDPSGSGVILRPHLTEGMQIFDERTSPDVDNLRLTDGDTATTKAFPSSRRGHSFTYIDHIRPQVYMFGGRTDGYSCALSYKDTLDLGTPESGINVYSCASFVTEVSELWTFDIHTYKWVFVDTSLYQSMKPLPPREQHVSSVIDGNMYVFGGKSRKFASGPDGEPVLAMHKDKVHGDLYRLNVPRTRELTLKWQNSSSALPISQEGRTFATIDGATPTLIASEGAGINARKGNCVEKVVLKVTINHQCWNQLKISIFGPGPQMGSPNFHTPNSDHEIIIFNQHQTNGTGCLSGTHQIIFDDDSKLYLQQCCRTGYNDRFRPGGRLSEFMGASTTNEWTLTVEDMKPDDLTGSLIAWEAEFIVSPCVWTYTWTNLTSTMAQAGAPKNRYAAKSIAYSKYLFVFGGRDKDDRALTDLFRFDTVALTWQTLTPINFYSAGGSFGVTLNTAGAVGANFMMTSWGILRYGGYLRQPFMTGNGDQYSTEVFLADPSTLRWERVDVRPCPDSLMDVTSERLPGPRYLSATAFIPASSTQWLKKFSYRNLYDKYTRSSRSNYASALADSILVFGGHDGTSGSMYDGSTGGMLSDLWLLRLSNFSTDGERFKQQGYLEQQCGWRSQRVESCLAGGTSPQCSFRDLMMLTWCAGKNVTIA